MELYVLEVLLRHRQYIAAVGKEHVASVLILSHVLVFALLETVKLGFVVALYPACLVEVYRLPAALGVVFVFQTVLDNLKLQLSHCADNLAAVELVDKHLCHTFVHELVDTLLQLLCLHRVIVLNVFEHLGREARQTAEVQLLSLGERVANLEYSVVGQTNDVARPSLLDGAFALCHELCWR